VILLPPRTSSHRRLTVIWLQRTIIQEALNWGVPLIFYWAVYDNTGSGYWLIDATNTPQPLYYSFQEHYKTNR
jgi:hypothetical protein